MRSLRRNARQFTITDVDQTFYTRARNMLNEIEAAETTVGRQPDKLADRIRINCSVVIAQSLYSPRHGGYLPATTIWQTPVSPHHTQGFI